MRLLISLILFIFCHLGYTQQIADLNFNSEFSPEYPKGDGPSIYIDEGHHNFHAKEGRYKPFADLLQKDGYQVKSYKGAFEHKNLFTVDILVVSNALHESNVKDWFLPNPSAFTKEEIEVVEAWVDDGGSLFLIADHMPLAGAATALGRAFGFEFTNGFAMTNFNHSPDIFNVADGGLKENIITNGRSSYEKVKEVASFTGQAFQLPKDAEPILMLDERFTNYLPEKAWVFDDNTEKHSLDGWCQGAYKNHGKGRVVVFGEAAMFSAQVAGSDQRKMGMNNPKAKDNSKLLLNIIHWLDPRF